MSGVLIPLGALVLLGVLGFFFVCHSPLRPTAPPAREPEPTTTETSDAE